MTSFFDTNVLVAAVTSDTDRSATAVQILNETEQAYTSILNVMELRSVLAKKKAFDSERIDQIEDRIARKMTVTSPTLRISSQQMNGKRIPSCIRWTHSSSQQPNRQTAHS